MKPTPLDVKRLAWAMRPMFDGPNDLTIETLPWWAVRDEGGDLLALSLDQVAERIAERYAALPRGPDVERWARWIVRQGRNPDRACPECGPTAWGVAPKRCVPHEALAALPRGL